MTPLSKLVRGNKTNRLHKVLLLHAQWFFFHGFTCYFIRKVLIMCIHNSKENIKCEQSNETNLSIKHLFSSQNYL